MNDNSRIHDKLEKIDERLVDINVTLARNTSSLEHHIERTNKLEHIVTNNQRAILWVEGGLKILAGLGFTIGTLAAIAKLVSLLL